MLDLQRWHLFAYDVFVVFLVFDLELYSIFPYPAKAKLTS